MSVTRIPEGRPLEFPSKIYSQPPVSRSLMVGRGRASSPRSPIFSSVSTVKSPEGVPSFGVMRKASWGTAKLPVPGRLRSSSLLSTQKIFWRYSACHAVGSMSCTVESHKEERLVTVEPPLVRVRVSSTSPPASVWVSAGAASRLTAGRRVRSAVPGTVRVRSRLSRSLPERSRVRVSSRSLTLVPPMVTELSRPSSRRASVPPRLRTLPCHSGSPSIKAKGAGRVR